MITSQKILKKHYQLQEQLSNNPTRKTWLAKDLNSQHQVIIKLLPLSSQTQWGNIKLFEREAQVLKHLNHPKIPRYLDYFSIDKASGDGISWFVLVQEYIPGTSLQQLLETGKKFSEAEVKEIAKQLLKILVYLHELSPPILHRDIKPSNILLYSPSQLTSFFSKTTIYLVDFGAVQDKAKAEGVTFTVVGTGGYAPPEQLWGKAVAASDLYALGATLIHLLTGIAPSELSQKEMQLQFQDKVKLSPGFANWLKKLINPAVERRFLRAKEALAAFKFAHKHQPKRSEINRKGNHLKILSGVTLASLAIVPLYIGDVRTSAQKSRQNRARNNIGLIHHSQDSYSSGRFSFSNSIVMLGRRDEIERSKQYYEYSIHATPLYAISYAIPHKNEAIDREKDLLEWLLGKIKLKGYVGIIAFLPDNPNTREFLTGTITCETTKPTTTHPPNLIFKEGFLLCPTGTKNAYPAFEETPKIEIRDRDFRLAYEATTLAEAGDRDRALKLARTIQKDWVKEKALKAIEQATQSQ